MGRVCVVCRLYKSNLNVISEDYIHYNSEITEITEYIRNHWKYGVKINKSTHKEYRQLFGYFGGFRDIFLILFKIFETYRIDYKIVPVKYV